MWTAMILNIVLRRHPDFDLNKITNNLKQLINF